MTGRDAVVPRLRAAGCVFAEDEAELLLGAADTPQQLAELVDRRCSGVPLEHVLGWALFRGRRIAVDPGVFVPRRRTEYLVEVAVASSRRGQVVVDLCCGSGAIGTAVAAEMPGVDVYAVDLDPGAVRCAQRNLEQFGGRAYTGDLYAPLPAALRGRVALLLVNAPYVPTGHVALLPPEARLYEPRVAYDGGDDGLDIQRRVSADAAIVAGAGRASPGRDERRPGPDDGRDPVRRRAGHPGRGLGRAGRHGRDRHPAMTLAGPGSRR